jgi:putative glycerol-1-phosphate prenyltransferase
LIFDFLVEKQKEYKSLSFALIDPDKKNDYRLSSMLDTINNANFDAILVGGSYISDNKFEKRIKKIKSSTDLPVILFPGDASQVSKEADAILFLSLLSGRNPKYLIEEQVKSSLKIYKQNIEVIPTGYILIETDKKSAVEIVSKTDPISMNDLSSILSHCLAAQFLGNKFLFIEAGSNSNYPPSSTIIKEIVRHINIPLIVGGGIKTEQDAKTLSDSGASVIVIGSLIEQDCSLDDLKNINDAIHT